MTDAVLALLKQLNASANDVKDFLNGVIRLSDHLHPATPLTDPMIEEIGQFIKHLVNCAARTFDQSNLDNTFRGAEQKILSSVACGEAHILEYFIEGELQALHPSHRIWERIFRILGDLRKRKFEDHFTESFDLIAGYLKAYNDTLNQYREIFFSQCHAILCLDRAEFMPGETSRSLESSETSRSLESSETRRSLKSSETSRSFVSSDG